MCFFNKIKTKEVNDFFEYAWQNVDIPELPNKNSRNNSYCKRSSYDTVDKKYCAYTLRTKLGKWEIDYRSSYNAKTKTCSFYILYFNLTVNHPDTIKAFKENFPQFHFYFNASSLEVSTNQIPVKKLDDIKREFYKFVDNWNRSGLFNIFNKYKSNEEIKK